MNSCGVMQPYFFPYLGYFQLIEAVDNFVHYDDVNYIKRGWINRNRVLINGAPSYLTVPIDSASQNVAINKTLTDESQQWRTKTLKQMELSYRRAPQFESAIEIFKEVVFSPVGSISELGIRSVEMVVDYLGIKVQFHRSSSFNMLDRGLDRQERLVELSKKIDCDEYINPEGGQDLYDSEYFNQRGINLKFLYSKCPEYVQFKDEFVPALSILDVLMFNSKEQILEQLGSYQLG
jgi:hypothetical protein